MSQERFDKGMKELKDNYNQTPSVTSSKQIFQAVKEEKQRKKRFQYWPVTAATIAALLIGAVLIGSLISTEEIGQEQELEPEHNGGQTGDVTDAPTEEESDDPEVIEEDIDSEEPGIDEAQEDILDVSPAIRNREDVITRTLYPEGMPADYTFSLHVHPSLGFSTYVEENMIADHDTSGDEEVVTFYPDFSGTGEINPDIAHVSITRDDGQSIDDLEAELIDRNEREGFEQHPQGASELEEPDRQGVFVGNGFQRSYALFEENEHIYIIENQMSTEVADGVLPFFYNTFIEELMFE
ncbi:hypothetical protein [Evansella halocellulosilytica]|uniref:hypothetical protein n=1 Tax=Evansella halocellulosilytica TaxID=2011013 RepID=UPI000BB9B5FA|nr:hypothetical protein [Evansella halocellulosilytica]